MSAIGWVIGALVLLLVEMVTPGLFFFACLAGGALLAALAAWLGAGTALTWGTFLIGSTLLVLGVAPLARRWARKHATAPVGLDALMGQRARVVEPILPEQGKGQVRLEHGALWRAISDQPIPDATWVRILEVKGTRLRVEPETPLEKE